MSDTLKTNQDQSDFSVDTFETKPNQIEPGTDSFSLQPLFQEEEDDRTYAPPRRRRWWLLIVSIFLLLVLIGGGAFMYVQRTKNSQVRYTTVPVSVGNLTETVSASGPLTAKAEYDLNFSTSGQISQIDVKVGQQVKAGQVLAKLNAPNLSIAVQQAQLSVDDAQQTYNTAVDDGDSQDTLNTASNALQNAQLQLQTAKNNLAAATLTAPASATVAAINGSVGQTAGSSSTSAFITLLDTSGFTITGSVNEADIANVQVNQPAHFTVSAYPSQTFQATVTSISIVGTTTSGVVSYPVTLTVDMSSIGSAHLYPGMTATISITTAQRIGVTLVSNSSFTFTTTALQAGVVSRSSLTQGFTRGSGTGTGTGSTGSRHVVLVLRNGKLIPVLITTGLTNGTLSEVLSGLNQGDQVVVSATGGPFANLSTTSGTGGTTTGGGLFRTGGGTRSGSGG